MGQFEIGSISTGTLRLEVLLPVFTDRLTQIGGNLGLRSLVYHYLEDLDGGDIPPDDAEYTEDMLQALTLALDVMCPRFVWFGAHPDDGADFGFWPDRDGLTEALHDPEYVLIDGLIWAKARDEAVLIRTKDDDVTVTNLDHNIIWSTI
jgi:hypothetical protein